MALALAPVAAADVVYSDTEFANANWGFETATVGTGGSSSATQVGGGNPGNARQLTNNVNAGGTIYGFSRFGTTVPTRYDPAIHGAIASVDWTIDAKWLSGIGGQGMAVMLGVKQGVVNYYADLELTGSSGQWTTHGHVNLTAADFQPLVGGPAIDFSATAAPLRFGFIVGNSGGAGSYSQVMVFDNFTTTVHNIAIPAPGFAGAAGILFGLVAVRRRPRGR